MHLEVISCVDKDHFNPRSCFYCKCFDIEVYEIYFLALFFIILFTNVGDFIFPYDYNRIMFGL